MLHPLTDAVVPYPHPLVDVNNFSPELILLWARRTVLYLEIELFEGEIADFERRKENGDQELIYEGEEERIT